MQDYCELIVAVISTELCVKYMAASLWEQIWIISNNEDKKEVIA